MAATLNSRVTRPALLVWTGAVALSVAWLIAGPATPDLAAQVFRAHFFSAHGFALYDPQWYGGHLLPAYSVLFPPLGALVGVRLAGAVATAVAIVLFDRLVRAQFGSRAWVGTAWFAAGATLNLLSARLTFALGVALGLGALVAAQSRKRALALPLAAACTLASPLAGTFLAGATTAAAVATRRWYSAALAAAAAAPALALEIAFPEGGTFGFSLVNLSELLLVLGFCVFMLPRAQRVLRVGFVLYAGFAVVAYAVPSPLGSNAVRLALLICGPLLACALSGRRALVLASVAPVLVLWSAGPTLQDLRAVGSITSTPGYYASLNAFLARHGSPPARVEIPFTLGHWETVFVGARFMLARGWERQLDRLENPIFYPAVRRPLDPQAYRRWLRNNGVRYVALPDARLDPSAYAERALIQRRPPYLRQVWRGPHWTVFRVRGARPLLQGPGALAGVSGDTITLRARRPGHFLLRMHYSPYWQLPPDSGCVLPTRSGWTAIDLTRAGSIRLTSDFDLPRIASGAPQCS
jgi:hypothetical protein